MAEEFRDIVNGYNFKTDTINMTDEYTWRGSLVTILTIERPNSFDPVVFMDMCGNLYTATLTGKVTGFGTNVPLVKKPKTTSRFYRVWSPDKSCLSMPGLNTIEAVRERFDNDAVCTHQGYLEIIYADDKVSEVKYHERSNL